MKTPTSIVGHSLLAVALAGCAGDRPSASSPGNTEGPTTVLMTQPSPPATYTPPPAAPSSGRVASETAAQPGAPPPSATTGPGPGNHAGATAMQPGGPSTGASPVLGNDQILEVIRTVDAGELQQASLAKEKSRDRRVQQFAAMVIKDQSEADNRGRALANKEGFKLAPSPLSSSLEVDARAATSSLTSRTGADFDKQYIEAQIVEQQALLDLIDQTLVPAAKGDDVAGYLTSVRAKIVTHLHHAQDLEKTLGSSESAAPAR
jgi:putative membrane protein